MIIPLGIVAEGLLEKGDKSTFYHELPAVDILVSSFIIEFQRNLPDDAGGELPLAPETVGPLQNSPGLVVRHAEYQLELQAWA